MREWTIIWKYAEFLRFSSDVLTDENTTNSLLGARLTTSAKYKYALRNSKGNIRSMATQSNAKYFHLQVKISLF